MQNPQYIKLRRGHTVSKKRRVYQKTLFLSMFLGMAIILYYFS